MRTILFRGKRKTGEWVYGAAARTAVGDGYYILKWGRSYGVKQETLGQYTGLDDKNGKPIFEGDIVRSFYTISSSANYLVKWADDTAMFVLDAGKWALNFSSKKSIDVEVIGNIHDNPELLEVEG